MYKKNKKFKNRENKEVQAMQKRKRWEKHWTSD